MNFSRWFLGFNVLVWLPYGIYCFFQPGFLGDAAGLTAQSPTALTEVRAMYGGLEAGIGAFALAAMVRVSLVRPALLMLAFTCTGLALTRTLGAVLDGAFSGYTIGALCFEIPSAVIAILLARGAPEQNEETAGG